MPKYAKYDEVFKEPDAYIEVVCGFLNDCDINATIMVADTIVVTQYLPLVDGNIEAGPIQYQFIVNITNEIISVFEPNDNGDSFQSASFELCDPKSLNRLVEWFKARGVHTFDGSPAVFRRKYCPLV